MGTRDSVEPVGAGVARAISRRTCSSERSRASESGASSSTVGLVHERAAVELHLGQHRRHPLDGPPRRFQLTSATFVTIFIAATTARSRATARRRGGRGRGPPGPLTGTAPGRDAASDRLGGARQRRRLAARIVTDPQHHAAVAARAAEVAVADRVGRAVEARVLAVPPTGDAIDLGPRATRYELCADHARRGEPPRRARAGSGRSIRHPVGRGGASPGRSRQAGSPGSPTRRRRCSGRRARRHVVGRTGAARLPGGPSRRSAPASSSYLSERLTSRRLCVSTLTRPW